MKNKAKVLIIGGFMFDDKFFYPLINSLKNKFDLIFFNINSASFNSIIKTQENLEKTIYKFNPNNIIAWSLGATILISVLINTNLKNLKINQIILLSATLQFLEDRNWNGVSILNFNKLYKKIDLINSKDKYLDCYKYFLLLCNYPNNLNSNQLLNYPLTFSKDNLIESLLFLKNSKINRETKEFIDINKNLFLFIYGSLDILIPYNFLPCRQIIINGANHLSLLQELQTINFYL